MFTIGTFARLGDVSIRTLRHYDEIGLLTPARVDPANGYRSYVPSQLLQLHRITALKELGLTLDEIRTLLLDEPDPGRMKELLEQRRDELTARVNVDLRRLARVEQRLRYLETEYTMTTDLSIRHIPATRVAEVRSPDNRGLGWSEIVEFALEAIPTLLTALKGAGVTPEGPVLLHYAERADLLIPTVAVPIGDQPIDHVGGIYEGVLAESDVIVAMHRGGPDHGAVGPVYSQMAQFAEDHGYLVNGPGRDHIVSSDGDDMVFELQLPVTGAVRES